MAMALAGAPAEARVEIARGTRRDVLVPQSLMLQPGDRLIVRAIQRGARTYLATLGGFQTAPILGSRSSETPVRAGEWLEVLPSKGTVCWPDQSLARSFDSLPRAAAGGACELRVVVGPDAGHERAIEWTARIFRVSASSDRMGLRLETENGPDAFAELFEADRLSAPVAPGAVQATPGGLIVLGVACGTMGGYPIVAHVISADLDRLGQLRPGDRLAFREVELGEARALDQERLAQRIKVATTIRAAATACFV
jgi:allophanate hydrolase subunit 2